MIVKGFVLTLRDASENPSLCADFKSKKKMFFFFFREYTFTTTTEVALCHKSP